MSLLDLIAPPLCLACGRAGRDLCAACRRALAFLGGARCPRCALDCGGRRCPAAALAFDGAWAPVAHDGPARDLVIALKFRSAHRAAREMAAQIAALAPPGYLDDPGAVLVPVPSHPRRRARRGYDQATLLARAVARRSGRPCVGALRRRGRETRQLGAGREERLAAGRIVVEAAPAAAAARCRQASQVVLVDDVHTTGGSFDACARALRAAGTSRVMCISYSRSL